MPTYYRVMTEGEWEQVQRAGTIQCNRDDWSPHYPPGSVVFLFSEKVKEPTIEQVADDMVQREGSGVVLVEVELDAELPGDESGWGGIAGVVHHGALTPATGVRLARRLR